MYSSRSLCSIGFDKCWLLRLRQFKLDDFLNTPLAVYKLIRFFHYFNVGNRMDLVKTVYDLIHKFQTHLSSDHYQDHPMIQ